MLTGWAGQISLGQMGFVAIGAAVGRQVHLELERRPLARPAGRRRGRRVRGLRRRAARTPAPRPLPRGHHAGLRARRVVVAAERPLLRLGAEENDSSDSRCSVASTSAPRPATTCTRWSCSHWSTSALRGVRHSRTGRAIVALRENERAAQAYAVSPVPVKLMAFTISGAVAGVAGGLFVHLSQSFDLASYGPAAEPRTCSPPASSAGSGRSSVACSAPSTCGHRLVHHRTGLAVPVVGGRRADRPADPARRPRQPRDQASRPVRSSSSATGPRFPQPSGSADRDETVGPGALLTRTTTTGVDEVSIGQRRDATAARISRASPIAERFALSGCATRGGG